MMGIGLANIMANLGLKSTLNIIFSVTYYLGLHNAISINCTSHILQANVKLVVWT